MRTLCGGSGQDVAIVSEGALHTYGQLARAVEQEKYRLATYPEGPAFLLFRTDLTSIVQFLACYESGRIVFLLDPAINSTTLETLVTNFCPNILLGSSLRLPLYRDVNGAQIRETDVTEAEESLALLIPTSGSTGSSKMVKLSRDAIAINASQIVSSLSIAQHDRAVLNLPLFYSYGLSILTSHLVAGASLYIPSASSMQRTFWEEIRSGDVTSFAGVPFTYQSILKGGFKLSNFPAIKRLTQAGGRLEETLVSTLHDQATRVSAEFNVMYGQTEATARMAVLQHQDFLEHPGSVGRAVPGGSFEIIDNEIHYSGPNVMLGYASDRQDLAKPDEFGSNLPTGDQGRLEGRFLFITGRSSRIIKINGLRVDLNHLEEQFGGIGRVTAVEHHKGVRIFVEPGMSGSAKDVLGRFSRGFARSFEVVEIEDLPRTSNGKIDYRGLSEL